jgi:cell division protein FtsI (penicillin-binding protein 3)
MAGESRIKGLASSPAKRKKPREATRTAPGGSRKRVASAGGKPRAGGNTRGRKRKKGGAKVVPLPLERRSRRSRPPNRQSAKKAVGRWRLRLVVWVVAVICISLGARAAQLSVANDDNYQAFAAEQRPGATAEDRPGRGSIISADGQPLAMSLAAARVVATPYQVKDPKAEAEALADALGSEAGDAAEIEGKLAEKNDEGNLSGYSVVAKGIEPDKAREVQKLGLRGVSVEPDEVRTYPNGQLAPQLIGHLGTDRAYGGIEARYDDILKSGQDVDLTLDTAVQQELEGALPEAAKKYEGKSALGLVMRVEDGAIMAMANTPGYDNNHFENTSAEAQRNRILTDPYEPGSTLKPFTIAAALEEGAITEDSTFVVPESIQVADRLIRDSEWHPTEILDARGILEHSRNVGTIQIAQKLGGELLTEHLKSFGFGKETGVDLLGEDAGRVPPFEEWSGSSIGNIPIGQGITVTPLQLAAGYAALANGGHQITPYVNKADAPDEPGPQVISKETSSIVRGMLQSVVDEGSGHLAQIPGYTVAGKTGTAQKVDPETGLYGNEYVTSFIGYAPAQNPEYLTLIVVDEPQKDIFGEVVAAPAFQNVMSFTLGYYNFPPDRESTRNDPPPPNPTPAPDARKEDRLR